MTYTQADLDAARREASERDAHARTARTQVEDMERKGVATDDARLLLKHLEDARRASIVRLGEIRQAIGPSAF